MASQQQFEQLVQQLAPAGKLIHHRQLTGGVSAQVFGIEWQHADGNREKLLVRIHGEVDRARNPQIAADEFRLLRSLHSADLAVPKPVFVDAVGDLFGRPCIVIEFVEGSPAAGPKDSNELAFQLAAQLARIHRVDVAQHELDFLPRLDYRLPAPPAQLDDSLSEWEIRDRLAALAPISQINKPALLHGDYWPGNILWQNGKLAAVIDWEDAQIGDPLADVANCRLELLWAIGMDAMEQFTQHYRTLSMIAFADLRYWDLRAALRPAGKLGTWGLDPAIERTMREKHRWFVEKACTTV